MRKFVPDRRRENEALWGDERGYAYVQRKNLENLAARANKAAEMMKK